MNFILKGGEDQRLRLKICLGEAKGKKGCNGQ